MLLALIIMVISISCTFAEDGATVGTGRTQQIDSGSITLDEITDAKVDNNIDITGKVTDETGNPVSDSDINITLTQQAYGDKEYKPIASETVKTDNNGAYSYTYTSNVGGQLNITADNNLINHYTKESVFIAPISTIVTMNTRDSANIGESLNITGRLTDTDGNALRYTGVGILVCGTPYGDHNYSQYSKQYTRTDKDGYYNYIYTPSLSGRFDITAYYPGYHRYRFNRTDLSVRLFPKSTKVNINPLENIYTGDDVTISGTLTDGDDNPLRYTSVGMLFNGKNKTYVRTSENGSYSYTYTPENNDSNITVYYPGYHNYAFTQTITGFNVKPNKSMIILDSIENISYGESIEVSGKVIGKDGNPITDGIVLFYVENIGLGPDASYLHWMDIPVKEDGLFYSDLSEKDYIPLPGNYSLHVGYEDNNLSLVNVTNFSVDGKTAEISCEINNSNPSNPIITGRVIDEYNNPLKNKWVSCVIFWDELNAHYNGYEFLDGFNPYDEKTKTDDDGRYYLNSPIVYSDITKVIVYPLNDLFEHYEAVKEIEL